MSSKKNKFSKKDKLFMEIALDLARSREGLTGTNPSVGCVIVKNNNIISIGQTSYNGRPHAEFNAIKSCKKSLKGSTLYSTLEPCAHFGKTPPCCNLIIKSKIKEYDVKSTAHNEGTVVSLTDGIARIYGITEALQVEMLEYPNKTIGMAIN